MRLRDTRDSTTPIKEDFSMPLRPDLYRRLLSSFHHVLIANADEEMTFTYATDALTGRPRMEINHSGEYYKINCCFCPDTRHRLWINHRWGYRDPVTKSRNLHLAHCYNEDCLRSEGRPQQLYADLFADVGDGSVDVIMPVSKPVARPTTFYSPGTTTPLHELPADHPACQYLQSRGFDPQMLSRRLGLTYCTVADHYARLAQDRIIIPVTMNGNVQGWQGRFVGEPTSKWVPKYYTMPSLKKSELLYNFDIASQYSYVVITEGVTDVWRVGPTSVALFGKTLSATQQTLITSTWRQGTVYVMLDSDARQGNRTTKLFPIHGLRRQCCGKSRRRRRNLLRQNKLVVRLPCDARPDAQKICNALRHKVKACVNVQLPDGKDPGSLTQQEIQALLAKPQGDQLPFLDKAQEVQALLAPPSGPSPLLTMPQADQPLLATRQSP